MKKVFAILVVLSLLAPCIAHMETFYEFEFPGLETLSFEELVKARSSMIKQIDQMLMEHEDWQAVEVPQGIWVVGEDIPAGHWTIKCSDSWARVRIGDALTQNGKAVSAANSVFYYTEQLHHPSKYGFNEKVDMVQMDITLQDGMYVDVSYANVIFTPYAGKPALGFK